MSAIAQRRVAGATALMILLYLLQVALFAPNASADHSQPYEYVAPSQSGNVYSSFGSDCSNHQSNAQSFRFVFVNGTVIEGNNCFDSTWHDDSNQGGQNSIFRGADGSDAFQMNQETGMSVHVSCSSSFAGGWAATGGPNSTADPNWQIASYAIAKDQTELDDPVSWTCDESFVAGSITVVKTTSPGTSSDFDFELTGSEAPCPESGTGVGCGGTFNDTQSVAGTDSGADENAYTWTGLNSGDYALEELTANNPNGYALASATCEDASGTLDLTLNGDVVSLTLTGGQHITCTFHNTSSTPGAATVSVSGTCAVVNGVAQFTYTVTASEGVTVDFAGGAQNVANGGTYMSSSSSASWTATAPAGDLFPNELGTTSGTATVIDCTPTPGAATVSVSGTCAVVNGVAQFTYTVTASEGVTVDFDGGDQNVTNGGTYVSSSSSASWTATAPAGDLFPNELGTTQGTTPVDDCTPTPTTTPQPQTATVSVSGVCVVNDAGTGVGQFTVTITPGGAATVTINGLVVGNGESIELPDDSTYPVTVVAAAGWTLSGDIPTEASVGDCPDDVEVLGTTITTVPEVSADTLPFTGSESGDMVKLAMLALLAGALMLFAVRGPKEEEEIATEIGGWSDL